jgi:uncharacterized protein involved in exopolysaccharide biosynthesis
MEEYEVDLRDYFRVIWRKKWIILGVFLAAVVAALLLSLGMPNQYRAEAFYQLNQAPQATGIKLNSPSIQAAVAMLSSRELLQQAAREAEVGDGAVITDGLKVTSQKGDLLQLELKGTLSPDALQRVLTKLIELFSAKVRAQLQGEIEEELSQIARRTELLEEEGASLKDQIDKLLGEEGNAQLKVGEFDTTLEGFALRQELSSLYARLSPIQRELDNLRLSQEELSNLANLNWEPLLTISPPYASTAPVGPNRKMNVAVAGVLGLFVGILLAFFVHYMEGGKEVEKEEK